MIVPMIMAIWFGYRASKAGRSVIAWAVGGAALSFVANTILANAAILMMSGSLTPRMGLDTYIAIRIVAGILAVAAMIFIGRAVLPTRPTGALNKPSPTQYSTAPQVVECVRESPRGYGPDLRIFIGWMFAILGGILTVFGFFRPGARAPWTRSNVNVEWGMVLLVFAAVMLGLGYRAQVVSRAPEQRQSHHG